MKIGLFFGSFNPVHIGHMAIANYILEFSDLDKIWFVVSPHNPLKSKSTLLADHHRLDILYQVIKDEPNYEICDVEFRMPKPSYTIDTLAWLKDKYPEKEFAIIMGADNLATLSKWKNSDLIKNNYLKYVYPRPGYDITHWKDDEKTKIIEAPLIEISSSFIRDSIKKGKKVKYFLPLAAFDFIDTMNFYK